VLGLIAAVLFGGYLLVYAAVANGGKFASTPWEALRTDAYTGGTATSGSAPHHSALDTWIGKPGHRGIIGDWIAGIAAGKTSGSPEPKVNRGAFH
jgi:hypothetical protein